jgi:predicted enzyme related to lactoylglutathione lyase
MTQSPAWFDITAQDAARSRRFYAELFGWDIRVDESMDYGLVGATPTGGIGQARDGYAHPPGVVVYFTVDDVEAALEKAERLGGMQAVAPWEIPGLGKMAVFQDPDGNRIGLWQQG